MTELHEALEALPCRHMLAILDCCFAGAFRWSSKRDFQPLPPVIYKERYDRFIRDAAWQVITSASYDQKALDILSGTMRGEQDARQGQQHSPFALALFDALGGAADTTPKDGDGVITATELYLYLRDEVEVPAEELAAHRQTPGLWPLNRHEHGEFIFLVPGHELNLPPAPDLTEKNNPYKGLSPYEKGDSELFFGRTDLVKKLKRRVAKLPFTVVLGASGTGKSSLVKAGLLPALEHGANKEKQSAEENDASQPSSWFILERVTEKDGKKKKEVMRPGANPLATLRSLLINDLPGVRPERKGGATPAGMIGQWRKKNPGLKLLLVIDQFEELITLCREEQARKDFIRELRQALDEHSKVLRIVLTLRSDFEAQISQNYLKECWRQNYRFVVPPMTQDELREVIEEPASLRVLYFEPRNLVDDLINEVVQTPGSLPLLSFTLSELYRRYVKRQKDVKQQDGNRALTKADYEKMGGIIGSLRSRIEQKYNELDVAQKKTLRRILLRMVAFEGGELTRRQAPEWEFTYPSVKETKEVKELLKGLTKNRLIVVDERNDAKGKAEPYYEAVHDSLIVAWDKMFEWRDNEAEKMLLHRQLTRAAGDWKRGENEKERKALLWDNSPRLLRVQEFLEQEDSGDMGDGTKVERKQRSFRLLRQFYKNLFPSFAPLDQHVWLNRVETDFVRRSVERKRNWTRGVSVFISVIIVTLIAAWWITNDARIEAKNQQGRAETARDEADKERKNAVSALNKANNNIGLALNEKGKDAEDRRCNAFTHFYSLHALTKISKEKEEAYGEALLRALGNPVQLPVVTIAINSSHDLWIQYLEDTAPIFLPDDRTLATDTGFWDAVTGKVVNADDETHAFWDMIVELRSRKEPWDSLGLLPEKSATMLKRSLEADRVGAAPLVNMALSPDNRILAAGYYDGYSSAWDVLNGRRLLASKKFGRSIAFSPDGNVLATGPILWDITTSNRLLELNLAGYKTTFSHDGLTLVTSSNDTAYLWDISAYNRQIAVLKDNLATSMTFSFDGRMLATGSGGNTIHLWDTATGKSFKTQTVDNHVETLSFSPTDYILAAAISDNTVVLLDVSTGNLLRILHVEKTSDQVETGNELDVKSMVFSPDGHMIATGLSNGIVVIWNTVMGNRLMTLTLGQGNKTEEDVREVISVAFSPDGNTLAIGSSNGDIFFWDIATGKLLRNVTWEEKDEWNEARQLKINDMAFSSDGHTLTTVSYMTCTDSNIATWDVATGRLLREITLDETLENTGLTGVASIAFSPNTRTIATGSCINNANLWDTATGNLLLSLDSSLFLEIGGDGGEPVMERVVFSPDGRTLATSSGNGVTTLWDLENNLNKWSGISLDKNGEYKINSELPYKLEGSNLVPEPESDLYKSPAHWSRHHPFHWLQKAEKGDNNAMLQIGIIYDRNNDITRALRWYKKAIQAGNERAKEQQNRLVRWMQSQENRNTVPGPFMKSLCAARAEFGLPNNALKFCE